MQVQQLKQALDEAQKQAAASVTAESNTNSKRKKKKTPVPDKYADIVRLLGKSYAVLADPWITPQTFLELRRYTISKTFPADICNSYKDYETYQDYASYRLYEHLRLKGDEEVINMASAFAGFSSEVRAMGLLLFPNHFFL